MEGKFLLKTEQMAAMVGCPIYWLWCDSEGNPEGEVQEAEILYFYLDKNGVGIATDYYDGHIGYYTGEGVLGEGGVRRLFLFRENAEAALKGSEIANISLGKDVYLITQDSNYRAVVRKGIVSQVIEDGFKVEHKEFEHSFSSTVYTFKYEDWGKRVHPSEAEAQAAVASGVY